MRFGRLVFFICLATVYLCYKKSQMTQQEAEVILKVNSEQTRKEFEALEKKSEELRKKFAEAFKNGDTRGIRELNRELTATNRQMDRLRLESQNIRAAMSRLNEASPKELQRTIKLINTELNSGRVKRGSKEWDYYIAQLRKARTELESVRNEIDGTEGTLSKLNRKFNDWSASIAAGAAAFAGLVLSGKQAVQAYAEMEAEEANVRKFTGMTEDEVERLNDAFKKMDTRTSREGLNKLAQEAGRLGKSSQEDVRGFVRAADQINVALDDLGEGATLTLSKLTNIFGDEERLGTERSLLAVGSVVNELSQNCTASAPYLTEFAQRLAGVGAQAKMTVPQIMSYAAVLDSQGQNVEASATALSQLVMKMYQEPAKIAKAAGMDVEKFSEILKRDANDALIELLKTLNSYGGIESLATIFDEMGADGARSSAVIAALAGNVEMLTWEQKEANKAFKEATSITNEYNVQNSTVQAKLDKAKKGFTEVAVALGQKLTPVMGYAISGTSMLIRTLNVLIGFLIDNAKAIIPLIAAFVAYNVAIKAHIVAQTAANAVTKLSLVLTTAKRAAVLLTSAAYNALTGNIGRATAATKLFSLALRSNPIGLLVGVLAAVIAAVWSYVERINDQIRSARAAKKAHEEYIKSLTDIDSAANDYAANELARLKALYKAATDEANSKKERIKASKELQKIYPTQFANMSAEQIMLGKARKAYDDLTASIINNAKAKAAAEKILENEKKILELEEKRGKASQKRREASAKRDSIRSSNRQTNERAGKSASTFAGAIAMAGGGSQEVYANTSTGHYDAAVVEATKEMNEHTQGIRDLNKANKELADRFRSNPTFQSTLGTQSASANVTPSIAVPKGSSGKDGNAQREVQKESEEQRREAEREAREALKRELEEKEAAKNKEEAQNYIAYRTGLKDYLKFAEDKEKIDRDYLEGCKKILQERGKEESVEYARILKKEEELNNAIEERKRKASLSELDRGHASEENAATTDYFDPDSEFFQNDIKLKDRLLANDIEYLKKKQNLYAENSDEWNEIQAQIDERGRQNQLEKQKELAERYLQFQEEYGKASGGRREQMELAILDQLLKEKLIKEEDYQKAVRKVKDKYIEEDEKKLDRVESEHAELVENVYDSFTKLFNELGEAGTDFWNNLTEASQAAFALMSAMLAQYSAYSNAERDVEINKIEKRYTREIAAAGKNTKKKERLEKQKEAEVAKVKKQYNDRAMKVEMAQAVAQTAMAAIAAYASGSKVNVWLGPVAAALATAAGLAQIAIIKKQHEAEAAGFYSGGFTTRHPDNRKEVGVVHANEFVANHQAVANPALSPVLRLIDHAQKNNTVGSLTADDVSRAIGRNSGVGPGGATPGTNHPAEAFAVTAALMAEMTAKVDDAVSRLSRTLDSGIEAYMVMDGENGFHSKYRRYLKLTDNPKR